MQHLEVSGAVRPLKWPLGVEWLPWGIVLIAPNCTYLLLHGFILTTNSWHLLDSFCVTFPAPPVQTATNRRATHMLQQLSRFGSGLRGKGRDEGCLYTPTYFMAQIPS